MNYGNTVGRLSFSFPPHQVDVIIGSLLGDACLECRSLGKKHPVTARLRIHHGERQKEYVFWKYKVLKNLVTCKPRRIKSWYNKRTKKDYYSWYFHTKSSQDFGMLYHYFYKEGVKIFPENISEFVNPRVMAVWFMDDGSNIGKGFTLNTHCFSIEEQEKIVRFLEDRFAISATIIKDRTKYKVAIGRCEYEKFRNMIKSFIIPSMTYKTKSPRND